MRYCTEYRVIVAVCGVGVDYVLLNLYYVAYSTSSITWYRLRGGDALRLGR